MLAVPVYSLVLYTFGLSEFILIGILYKLRPFSLLDFDEGDEQKYELAANSKKDLDDWMDRIRNAG